MLVHLLQLDQPEDNRQEEDAVDNICTEKGHETAVEAGKEVFILTAL